MSLLNKDKDGKEEHVAGREVVRDKDGKEVVKDDRSLEEKVDSEGWQPNVPGVYDPAVAHPMIQKDPNQPRGLGGVGDYEIKQDPIEPQPEEPEEVEKP